MKKSNLDTTLLQRLIAQKEAEQEPRSKMSLDDLKVEKLDDRVNLYDKATGRHIGAFPYRNATIDADDGRLTLDKFINMDSPYLEQPYRRRGIGE